MDLFDINVIKPLLANHGFHFSKSKGQNFLTARWVPERIAAESGIDDGCGVLEVGPGIGVLTSELGKAAAKVCAVELDKMLIPVLAETLGGRDIVRGIGSVDSCIGNGIRNIHSKVTSGVICPCAVFGSAHSPPSAIHGEHEIIIIHAVLDNSACDLLQVAGTADKLSSCSG